MSIDDQGFLSIEIEDNRTRNREEHAALYKLAGDISSVGQRILLNMHTPTAPLNVLMATFFGRGLQTFQAAVLMAERSLITETQMLTRSVLETLFYLAAAREPQVFGKALHRDGMKRRIKSVQHAIEAIDAYDPTRDLSEYREWLKNFKAYAQDAEEMRIIAVAEKAGMMSLYKTLYVRLSNYATHPTMRSIEIHWEKDSEGEISSLIWGPDIHSAQFHASTLATLLHIGLELCRVMHLEIDSRGIGIAIEGLYEEYSRITKDIPAYSTGQA